LLILFFFTFFIVVLGVHCDIYSCSYNWVYPLHHSSLSPSANPESFNKSHFSIYMYVYTVLAVYSLFYTMFPHKFHVVSLESFNFFCMKKFLIFLISLLKTLIFTHWISFALFSKIYLSYQYESIPQLSCSISSFTNTILCMSVAVYVCHSNFYFQSKVISVVIIYFYISLQLQRWTTFSVTSFI
jgi:hypothetical protein